MSTRGPPSIATAAPTGGAVERARARATCVWSDGGGVAARAAEGMSTITDATANAPPTRRTTCVSTPRAAVLRALLHHVLADGRDLRARPAVVGLARRRAHHLLHEHEPAGNLVARDERPGVLGQVVERRSRAFSRLHDRGDDLAPPFVGHPDDHRVEH